jgi:cell fate regulator YaaT (PSP1 superfamily)
LVIKKNGTFATHRLQSSFLMEKTNFISDNSESGEDIYVSCEHSYEADEITANPFLTRGLCQIPSKEEEGNGSYRCGCCAMSAHNWLGEIDSSSSSDFNIAEVQFKNSHKEFVKLPEENFNFEIGDIVAIEASPGHDIGVISLLGEAVKLQMKKKKASQVTRKIYRRAKASDIEKWIETVSKEKDIMMRSRYAAWDLHLKMKVNDVECQGDGTKAIFYYSADERIDFRELIKKLAEMFKIRIEMRQIGVRQEAARLGGIGTCGRELCCASWINHFQSVSTSAARTQQLSLNPQKLAGQCGKLKCCLNYENETYLRELESFPSTSTVIQTEKGRAVCHKIDIFKKLMWYGYKNDSNRMLYAIPVEKVKEIIEINKKNKISELEDYAEINQGEAEDTNFDIEDLKRIND